MEGVERQDGIIMMERLRCAAGRKDASLPFEQWGANAVATLFPEVFGREPNEGEKAVISVYYAILKDNQLHGDCEE